MKKFNKNVDFNVEEAYSFYMQRLSTCLAKSEQVKGEQMKRYLETSVLFGPKDVNYTKEELEEKLQKVNKIKEILENMLED